MNTHEDADNYLNECSFCFYFTCRISVSEVNRLAILHMNTWSEKNAPLALLNVVVIVKGLCGDIKWGSLIKDRI